MMIRPVWYGTLACLCSAAAQETPQQAGGALLKELTAETTLLEGVTDEASAQAALPELRACLERLAAMRGGDEAALWAYINNTPDVKTNYIEQLARLAVQFTRLEKAGFYNCAELQAALAPQLQAPAE